MTDMFINVYRFFSLWSHNGAAFQSGLINSGKCVDLPWLEIIIQVVPGGMICMKTSYVYTINRHNTGNRQQSLGANFFHLAVWWPRLSIFLPGWGGCGENISFRCLPCYHIPNASQRHHLRANSGADTEWVDKSTPQIPINNTSNKLGWDTDTSLQWNESRIDSSQESSK